MTAKELEKKILEHKKRYYDGNPIISDAEYDELEERLKQEKPDSFVLNLVGSITNSKNKIKHATKMLSLEKSMK